MSVDCFLDTNVLVYAATGRQYEEEKRVAAYELMEIANFALSAQVLQEFFVTVTRKAKPPLSVEDAMEWIEQLAVFPIVAVDAALVKVAIETSARHRISYWDGAVVAAADAAGASVLYTEDLSDGQVYGNVRCVNPFRPSPP